MKRPFLLGLAALVVLAVLPVLPAAPAGAAFPGRNARIVFMRFDGGLAEIQSMTATGGGLLNLTNTPLIEDRSPAWSADGKRIAFRRGNSAGPDQLWVMNADGTGLTVVPGSGSGRNPAWSPDGKRLVYECPEPQSPYIGHICLREVTGGGFTLLSATPGADDTKPSWSPDGTRIVWSRVFAPGGGHLVVLTLKNLSLDPLTPPVAGGYDSWPDWSPDGKQVAFSRNPNGVTGASIYRIPADGKGAAQLVVGPPAVFDSHHTMPAWSPDGTRIAYVHLDDDEVWGNIYTITPDGKNNTQLTFGAATDETPDWGVT